MFQSSFIEKSLQKKLSKTFEFSRFWTDSRSVQSGDVFVAIKGEKFDGHKFVADVAVKGAIAAIVSEPISEKIPVGIEIIQVNDTIEALRACAKAYRESLKTKIFAVAGSNGKTTTKEWMSHLLTSLYGPDKIFKTKKSENSILGIALSLLQIRNEEFAVIEVGIDEPGWMEKHLEVVQPDAGLVTTIAEEHLQNLISIEKVAEEELKLAHYLRDKNLPFAANVDSEWIRAAKLPAKTMTYALQESADIEGVFNTPQTLHAFGLKWTSPLPGHHNAQNLLAALTALHLLHDELTIEQFRILNNATAHFEGEKHRSLWMTLSNGMKVFDDCYNANPDSMEKSLHTFTELADGLLQKVIIGDMFDLGDSTEKAHQRILNLVSVLPFEQVILIGNNFAKAHKNSAYRSERIISVKNLDEAKVVVEDKISSNDCVMLKASRGMALENLIPTLEKIQL